MNVNHINHHHNKRKKKVKRGNRKRKKKKKEILGEKKVLIEMHIFHVIMFFSCLDILLIVSL